MNLLNALWRDECGYVMSAEAAMLGTVGVLGATVGLNMAGTAVNDEMTEMAYSFRSLDQSYAYQGTCSCRAWTAGSCYIQPPVNQSIQELCAAYEPDRLRMREEIRRRQVEPVVPPAIPVPETPPAHQPAPSAEQPANEATPK